MSWLRFSIIICCIYKDYCAYRNEYLPNQLQSIDHFSLEENGGWEQPRFFINPAISWWSYFIILGKQRSIRLYMFCTHTLLYHSTCVAKRNLKSPMCWNSVVPGSGHGRLRSNLAGKLWQYCVDESCHSFDNVMSHFIFTIQFHSMLLLMRDITVLPILKLRLNQNVSRDISAARNSLPDSS